MTARHELTENAGCPLGMTMAKKSDHDLGLDRPITRRDVVQGGGALLLGLSVGSGAKGGSGEAGESNARRSDTYPPTRIGMRGSHPGSFEWSHALARDGHQFPVARDIGERYDLVVVGAGISGLATAYFYRQRFGTDVRILLLDNHDDFGGHAKRNEFHQGGHMVLALGGTHNLEWWNFSDTVKGLLSDLGVDVQTMRNTQGFAYGRQAANSPAMWFDGGTYGSHRLLSKCDLDSQLSPELIDQIPISEAGRASLKAFYAANTDLLKDVSEQERESRLSAISYTDFLRQFGGLTEDAVQLFNNIQHGGWGIEARSLSAREALEDRCPGGHLLGRGWQDSGWHYPAALWPDGNASLARLLVADLVPQVAPDVRADNIAVARFDYGQLDRDQQPARIRLNATAIRVEEGAQGVEVHYLKHGEMVRVSARHAVLACYHSVIPHICPTMSEQQKDAFRYQVKIPLILTNVLIRNTEALDRLGIDAVTCQGRLHARLFTFRGFDVGGYRHAVQDTGPVSLVFWGTVAPPEDAFDLKSQLRASRQRLLDLTFEDFEREVREVLDGLLGPAGFNVAEDILAITVNRWPHGYAYEYMDLWDPDWPEGGAPHEIARQCFGSIGVANADAGASAYTHVAIDQAFRAVSDLP